MFCFDFISLELCQFFCEPTLPPPASSLLSSRNIIILLPLKHKISLFSHAFTVLSFFHNQYCSLTLSLSTCLKLFCYFNWFFLLTTLFTESFTMRKFFIQVQRGRSKLINDLKNMQNHPEQKCWKKFLPDFSSMNRDNSEGEKTLTLCNRHWEERRVRLWMVKFNAQMNWVACRAHKFFEHDLKCLVDFIFFAVILMHLRVLFLFTVKTKHCWKMF